MKKLSESSQPERLRQMKNSDITFTEETEKELKTLKHRKINLSDKDAPEIISWENVEMGKFYRPRKKQITIRLDADILAWFQHAAKKYQTLINEACREYMKQHSKSRKKLKT